MESEVKRISSVLQYISLFSLSILEEKTSYMRYPLKSPDILKWGTTSNAFKSIWTNDAFYFEM